MWAFIRRNYFELIMTTGLMIGSITRIASPEYRKREQMHLPFGSDLFTWIIILMELSSPYFLLFAPPALKKIYILLFLLALGVITVYYIVTYPNLFDFRETCIYENKPLSVVFHIIYFFIFLWLAYFKSGTSKCQC